MNYNPEQYAAFQRIQARIYRTEAWKERELRERLARDPIAHFMRTLVCCGCKRPVTACECRDEQLPFCIKDEVTD